MHTDSPIEPPMPAELIARAGEPAGCPMLPRGTLPGEVLARRCIWCHEPFEPGDTGGAKCRRCYPEFMERFNAHLASPGKCIGPPFYSEAEYTATFASGSRPLTGPKIYNGGRRRAQLVTGDVMNAPGKPGETLRFP